LVQYIADLELYIAALAATDYCLTKTRCFGRFAKSAGFANMRSFLDLTVRDSLDWKIPRFLIYNRVFNV